MKTGRENIHRRTDGRWEARVVIGDPKGGKTSYKYLYGKTYEEALDKKKALQEDSPFCLGILISLYGGPRIGEVCALQWGDFDFQNGTIRINKTIFRIQNLENGERKGTRLVIDSPKTDCSLRTIPLPGTILQYCQERRREDSIYVMTGTEKPMEPRACLARFKRLQKRLGLQEHTWHSLRHTFATRCVESGVDVKSLSEIMGHSDVEITMQRYVHPSMDTKREQVNKLCCFDCREEKGE